MTPRRPTAAILLEHQAFLRRLARSLVFDEQRAEDIVQDSFVVALERPMPTPARLRHWLAGIVRNGARRTLRSERRLRDRNQRGARSEALASTTDIALRLEAQRAIAAAVESLDEPGRSALVYRYFDGLKPARIARELGLPLRTVESRLRRAKAALRDSLDAQFGTRDQWHAALVPLVGAGALPISTAAASTSTASTSMGAASTQAAAASTTASTSTATSAGAFTVAGSSLIGVAAMTAKSVLGICVAAVLAGGAIGWFAKPASAPDDPLGTEMGAVAVDAGDASPELGSEDMVARAEVLQLQKSLLAVRQENDELKRQLADSTPQVAPADTDTYLEQAKALKAPRFRHDKFDKGLLAADWKQVAESTSRMASLIPKFASSAAAGKTDSKMQAEVMSLNMPLVQLALTLKTAEVPGDGINGAYTHPIVTINMVYATLIEAGFPLSDTQVEQLKELGDAHIQADEALRVAAVNEPFALATFLSESEIKDQLYRKIDAMLTPEQVNALHPEGARDRVMTDLFSVGLIWMQHLQASAGKTRDDIVDKVTTIAVSQFSIPAADRGAVARVVSDWMQSFQDKDMAPLDEMERANFVKMSRVRAAGRPMLAMYRELAREMSANPEVAKRIQEAQYVLLPVLME